MGTLTPDESKRRLEIAQTIIEQLGGRRFQVMTGAKNFSALDSGVQFSLPGARGYCKDGINKFVITLEPNDTYTLRAFRVRKSKGVPVETFKGMNSEVYNTELRWMFRSMTGLYTRL